MPPSAMNANATCPPVSFRRDVAHVGVVEVEQRAEHRDGRFEILDDVTDVAELFQEFVHN